MILPISERLKIDGSKLFREYVCVFDLKQVEREAYGPFRWRLKIFTILIFIAAHILRVEVKINP